MKCDNPRCHEFRHMKKALKKPVYHAGSFIAEKLPTEVVQSIRSFGSKTDRGSVAKCFHLPVRMIRKIQKREYRPYIKVPRTFLPPGQYFERLEKIQYSRQSINILLSPKHQAEAKRDIQKSGLSDRSRRVLLLFLSGKTSQEIGDLFGITTMRVYPLRSEALRQIMKQKGSREWIRLVSKGKGKA